MSNEIQNIHYCTILSAGQWDFLLEGRFSPLRQKCLFRLMNGAVRTRTAYKIKGIDIVLEVGQVAASDVELAEFLDCNRKTVGKLIARFNRLGMLTTRTNNRTSIHTLHFLTGWYVDGVLLTNPHYVKPAAVSKGQADGVRTPYSNDMPSENKPCTVPDGCQCPRLEADSMAGGAAALSSSLCSPAVSDRSEDRADAEGKADNPHIADNDNGQHENNPVESPKEVQDGTIDDVDDPDIAGRD
ncbi:hypothetical protein [Phocaeicola coprophilus]|uniref:hypothetical protein n=1 Tax=Phocaeicola coprophilus TaxID=387090 RepID=UPI003AEFD96E